jgi:hypothetical protein
MKLIGVGAQRVWLVAVLSVAGVLAVTAALAYACTVQPTVSLATGSAAPGSTVGGTGEFFSKTGGPVALHFNSLDSAVVWSGQPDAVGRIAFEFRVPEVAPGDYTIVATQTALGTGRPVAGTPSRAPLAVSAAQAPVVEAPVGAPAPRPPQREGDRPRTVPVAPGTSPAPRSQRPGPANPPGGADRSTSTGAAPASEAPVAPRSSAGPGAPTGKSGSGSMLPSGAGPAPSERSATGNVWEGFASDGGSSLVGGDGAPAPASGPGSRLSLGLGLLGIGLVALLGAFLVAATLRRRKSEQGRTPWGPAH